MTAADPTMPPPWRRAPPVAAAVAGKAAEAVTLVALLTLVPRALGPALYGELAVAAALVAAGSIGLSLGGHAYLVRYTSNAAPDRSRALVRALTGRVARVRGTGYLVLVAVVAVVALTGVAGDGDLLWIVPVAIGAEAAATLTFEAGLALGRTTAWSLRYPAQNALLLAFVLLLPADDAALALLAAPLVVLLAGLAGLAGLRHVPTAPAAELPLGRRRFAAGMAAAGLAQVLFQRGVVPATALLGATRTEVGFAGVAVGVALAGTYAVAQISAVQLPGLLREPGPAARAVVQARRLLLVVAPAAVLGAPLAVWLLPELAGPAYRPGAEALAPAVAVLPPAVALTLTAQLATIRLLPLRRLAATAAGLVAAAGAAIILVGPLGATGATAALLVGSSVAATVGTVALAGPAGARLLVAALLAAVLALGAGLAVAG